MIVLDTHTLIWWCNGSEQLSTKAKMRIDEAINECQPILVSSLSVWEISMLINKNRLQLSIDLETWIETVAEIESIRFVPVDNKIAIASTQLPGDIHKDPADRMIVALARVHSCELITADQKLHNYSSVNTLW